MNLVKVNDRWPLYVSDRKYATDWKPPSTWEHERLATMFERIEPGDVVYDVGSEEGEFPALFGTWGAEVVLIEPSPFAWPDIRRHWNTNVDRPPAGWFVGFATDDDDPHLVSYNDNPMRGWPQCAYNKPDPGHGFRHLNDEINYGRSSRHGRLDTLPEQFGWPAPDVVTVDVEGGEGHVLRGAVNLLRVHRPVVFVSVHPTYLQDLFGENADEHVHQLMADCGYEGTHIATDHEEHWMYLP